MITYLFISIFLAVLGLAAVITTLAVALPRARRRKELERERSALSSEQALETFIGRVNQALSEDELNHLDEERGDG